MPAKKSAPNLDSLDPDEILKAEFEYAANSAFQANEDRSKSASFFLVSVGSLVAAIFGAQQLELAPPANVVLAGLFLALTLLGLLTVMQLARLREAWTDAAQAMNRVKEYYISKINEEAFEQAFFWRANTIPKKYKPRSVSYFTVLEVALLSGFTFGASAYFLQIGIGYVKCLWAFTIGAGALAFMAELYIYKRMLK